MSLPNSIKIKIEKNRKPKQILNSNYNFNSYTNPISIQFKNSILILIPPRGRKYFTRSPLLGIPHKQYSVVELVETEEEMAKVSLHPSEHPSVQQTPEEKETPNIKLEGDTLPHTKEAETAKTTAAYSSTVFQQPGLQQPSIQHQPGRQQPSISPASIIPASSSPASSSPASEVLYQVCTLQGSLQG